MYRLCYSETFNVCCFRSAGRLSNRSGAAAISFGGCLVFHFRYSVVALQREQIDYIIQNTCSSSNFNMLLQESRLPFPTADFAKVITYQYGIFRFFKKPSIFVAVPSEASVSSPSSVSSGVSKTDLILTATLAQAAIILLESAL